MDLKIPIMRLGYKYSKNRCVMFHGFLQTGPTFVKMVTSQHVNYFSHKSTSFVVPTAPRIDLTGSDIHPLFPGQVKHLDPTKRAWIDIKSKLHHKTPENEMISMEEVNKTCHQIHKSDHKNNVVLPIIFMEPIIFINVKNCVLDADI